MRKQTEKVDPGLTTTNLAALVNGVPDEPPGSVQGVMKMRSFLKNFRGFVTSSKSIRVSDSSYGSQLAYQV